MKGTFVIVKAFGDKPLIRKIWGIGNNLVYIINIDDEDDSSKPVGFPIEDVYKYNEDIAKKLDFIDWSKMENWRPVSEQI